ncbi:MAG: hypothetical protein OWU84_13980 [Firmicutes bacterium]|nr:hypothetical protein [Bacillota bacterium]
MVAHAFDQWEKPLGEAHITKFDVAQFRGSLHHGSFRGPVDDRGSVSMLEAWFMRPGSFEMSRSKEGCCATFRAFDVSEGKSLEETLFRAMGNFSCSILVATTYG